MKIYDERGVVMAFIDARKPPYPHEDFRAFRLARLAALESAYGIRMSHEGVQHVGIWLLFRAAADSFLALRGPRAGFLDDSLINVTLERLDTPELQLRETEGDCTVTSSSAASPICSCWSVCTVCCGD